MEIFYIIYKNYIFNYIYIFSWCGWDLLRPSSLGLIHSEALKSINKNIQHTTRVENTLTLQSTWWTTRQTTGCEEMWVSFFSKLIKYIYLCIINVYPYTLKIILSARSVFQIFFLISKRVTKNLNLCVRILIKSVSFIVSKCMLRRK